jgi:hypothetical protein
MLQSYIPLQIRAYKVLSLCNPASLTIEADPTYCFLPRHAYLLNKAPHACLADRAKVVTRRKGAAPELHGHSLRRKSSTLCSYLDLHPCTNRPRHSNLSHPHTISTAVDNSLDYPVRRTTVSAVRYPYDRSALSHSKAHLSASVPSRYFPQLNPSLALLLLVISFL